MSCFNCYSSRKPDSELVDKILERGQRLRSAMVQSIVQSDPFYSDIVHTQDRKNVKLDELPVEASEKLRMFLKGDVMSRDDEVAALETLRSMSTVDLCRVTDRTYRSDEPCDCLTCSEYKEKNLNCDLRRGTDNEITQKIQEKYKTEAISYLKYVDSLKVSINSVVLNEAGDKKVVDSLVKDKTASVGQTFFLEYHIPEILTKNNKKNRAKVDSGLDSGSTVRLCSRRSNNQAVNFKQASVHDVSDLSKVKLEDVVIKFKLSFRNFKQKHPVSLGVAKFNFSSFGVTKNLTCNQEIAFKLNENTPLVVGTLRLSVQLGCGRLYFGKEFIDAITNNKENSIVLGSDDLSTVSSDFIIDNYLTNVIEQPKLNPIKPKPMVQKPEPMHRQSEPVYRSRETPYRKPEPVFYKKPVCRKPQQVAQKSSSEIQKEDAKAKQVLFCFVYISEAQFSREVMNSYVACQLLGQDDVSCSKLVAFDSNPLYNFSQQIPLVYNDELLLKLRENFMVVEFFEKDQNKDFLVGLAKLNLHQFYLAYRNPIIVKYLSEKKLPVIGIDGWETIIDPNNEETVGHVQILLALGTKEQIETLESERGFKEHIVKARASVRQSNNKRIDVATQSNMEVNKEPINIEALLNQIMARNNHVETSTNTDPTPLIDPELKPEVRSTSELLDSLQRALSLDSLKGEKKSFRAHVAVNNALHLPSRRKCKSRRSKGRSGKHEDILPSTYVTFETDKGELKMTPIVPKSTSPKWDYRCDVNLPIELLTNNQKFLVFKVWRKSTNTTMMPNMQTDVVIGFATVDLTVLAAGLPSVQGWYNINDLSKKCHGQINIHVTPLENISSYQPVKEENCCNSDLSEEPHCSDATEPGELLGRALKRKFTELDEITQRLRLRLSRVTNDESDTSNDEIADEFERDINTLCVEDDFDMVDFEKEARNFNDNRSRDEGLLKADNHLLEGKQKIDVLLEKLSLISGENSSRYVSGCSETRLDTEALLTDLDSHSRPNIHTASSFHKDMMQKFGCTFTSDSSGTISECRAEGEGISSEVKANE